MKEVVSAPAFVLLFFFFLLRIFCCLKQLLRKVDDMFKWAIDATNRIHSDAVPGSSKYILRELSEQFKIASSSIEGHYLHVRNDANKLETWMKRVLEGVEDIGDLLENDLEKVLPQLVSKANANVLPSPKSREITMKIPDLIKEGNDGQKAHQKESIHITSFNRLDTLPSHPREDSDQVAKFPVTPKRSLHSSSDSDDSFQAISAAIKRNVLEKELTSNLKHTPRSSSKFVSLPARTPIVLKSINRERKSPIPTISIKNRFSPRRLPVKKSSPIPKLAKLPLRLEAVVIPSAPLVSSPLKAPSPEAMPIEHEHSLWEKIGEYRKLSPKKSNDKQPIARSPITNSSPLRQPPLNQSSPAKFEIPPLKSPNLDRLAAPTVSSAAKKKKPDARKLENRFLTTTLQRTPRTFDKPKTTKVKTKVQPVQRSVKKSMMEQRSETKAPRQKIILNLRKVETKVLPDESVPQTPVKYTPENLPDVLSDDNQSPSSKVLQPWGRSPELYKIAKSKKKVDPFKIFQKSDRVNLQEVFNKQVVAAQSPAPTPDTNQISKYSKSMGFK